MTENQIIAEMMGKCWHDEIVKDPSGRCSKCDMGLAVPIGSCIPLIKNPDYSTGKDKADLMDWLVDNEKHPDFGYAEFCGWVRRQRQKWHFTEAQLLGETYAYLWRNLRELVAEYKGYKEGEK